MKYLALHTSHDGSLTYVVNNEIIFHTQIDRFNRIKHSSMPVKYLLDLINDLEFDTFITTKHIGSNCHFIWSSFLDKLKDKFKNVNIIHHDANIHHYFHASCSLIWDQNISDILVWDGTGANLHNSLFERETTFKYDNDLFLVKRYFNNIGLDYELKSLDIIKEEFAEAKTMAFSLHNKEAEKLQKDFEIKSINLIQSLNKKQLILTGGCAQNIILNSLIFKNFKKLFCDPFNTDSGISLGAINHETKFKIKNNNVYLGIPQKINTDLFHKYTIKTVEPFEVVEFLQENPVAIFQSRSEQGQRGLGNRSLLMNPCHLKAQEKLNDIKKREWYRPFACSILEEEASDWFDLKNLNNSPHMMYVFDLLDSKKNIIKCGISKDFKSRIQTVSKKDNEHYYNLLKSFNEKLKIPLLVNTSLNLPGEVLVETMYDLYELFTKSNLKYIYLPEIKKIILK
jgi:predicted NodU family carbamoyl transferase